MLRLGAALAYYGLTALVPTLTLVAGIIAIVVDAERLRDFLRGVFGPVLGAEADRLADAVVEALPSGLGARRCGLGSGGSPLVRSTSGDDEPEGAEHRPRCPHRSEGGLGGPGACGPGTAGLRPPLRPALGLSGLPRGLACLGGRPVLGRWIGGRATPPQNSKQQEHAGHEPSKLEPLTPWGHRLIRWWPPDGSGGCGIRAVRPRRGRARGASEGRGSARSPALPVELQRITPALLVELQRITSALRARLRAQDRCRRAGSHPRAGAARPGGAAAGVRCRDARPRSLGSLQVAVPQDEGAELHGHVHDPVEQERGPAGARSGSVKRDPPSFRKRFARGIAGRREGGWERAGSPRSDPASRWPARGSPQRLREARLPGRSSRPNPSRKPGE